ncbi:hypothetical protein HS125_10465 [bacterium]|nr:hypothetical protein [bacterium]
MNAAPPQEISLGSILAVLYRRRAFIAAGVLSVAAVTAVAALLWPKTFQAAADILVNPPGYKKTLLLVSEPNSVVTYEKRADNPNLKMEVVSELRILGDAARERAGSPLLSGLSEKEITDLAALDPDWLDDLDTVTIGDWMQVKTYIEEETNLGVKYANLLTLVARAPNAGSAAVLANLWAKKLLDLDQAAIQEEADRNIAFTVDSASRVQAQLGQIARRRENTPTLVLGEKSFNELETLVATLYGKTQTQTTTDSRTGETTTSQHLADTGLYGQLQAARQKVEGREKEIERLRALLAHQEEEGRWIGEPGVIQDAARMEGQVATLRRGVQADLTDNARRSAQLSAQLVQLASAEDAAWTNYVTYHILYIRPLKEETKPIPPALHAEDVRLANLYDDALQARKAKEAELQTARTERTDLQNTLLGLEARAAILTVLSAQKNLLPGQGAGGPALEELRKRYQSLHESLTRAQADLLAAQAERDSLSARISELEARRDALQLPAAQYLVERDNLERKLKLAGAFFDNEQNLSRLVEADNPELLRAPNLSLSSKAIPPAKRISPKRTRMVLLGAFAALLVFTLLAFVREGLENLPPVQRRP